MQDFELLIVPNNDYLYMRYNRLYKDEVGAMFGSVAVATIPFCLLISQLFSSLFW